MKIGFDVISDLNLDAEDEFNWDGKATSLYLVIAGNISNDLRVVHQTLLHLSRFYQGVFYIAGSSEHESMHFVKHRHDELNKLCRTIANVAYLHKHVVIINGIAILGCNGWYVNKIEMELDSELEKLHLHAQHMEDIQKILYNLFYDVLNIEFNLWSWIRQMCKYGDHEAEDIPVDGALDQPEAGEEEMSLQKMMEKMMKNGHK